MVVMMESILLLTILLLTILLPNFADPIIIKATDKINLDNFEPQECREGSTRRQLDRVCGRRIIDDTFSEDDMEKLQVLVEKGMAQREAPGGPTILDMNTGYIRDTNGLDNLFAKENDIYSEADFALYGKVILQLRNSVVEVFNLSFPLYFTAPTFFTRIDAREPWEAREIHDEYWHIHADMNNTEHYQYSGLLYLSTYDEDFTGGRLRFIRDDDSCAASENGAIDDADADAELIVEPLKGRLAIFSSGAENPHHVEKVKTGQRFVLSFWFTIFEEKQFEIFLDGKKHEAFSRKVGDQLKKRSS